MFTVVSTLVATAEFRVGTVCHWTSVVEFVARRVRLRRWLIVQHRLFRQENNGKFSAENFLRGGGNRI